jgi:ABC-type transport system involved in cytochrome bd biosynthesis fused ATPase/permease subunit
VIFLTSKALPVLVSIVVIVFIALISESSRLVAAVTATMPLTIPISMWIVYVNSGGQQRALVEYTDSLVIGFIAAMAFLVGAWIAARKGLGLWQTVAFGYGVWGGILSLAMLVRRTLG